MSPLNVSILLLVFFFSISQLEFNSNDPGLQRFIFLGIVTELHSFIERELSNTMIEMIVHVRVYLVCCLRGSNHLSCIRQHNIKLAQKSISVKIVRSFRSVIKLQK